MRTLLDGATFDGNDSLRERRRMNIPEDWPFDQGHNVAAVSDASVVDERAPVLLVVHFSDDDSWGFFLWRAVHARTRKLISMACATRELIAS